VVEGKAGMLEEIQDDVDDLTYNNETEGRKPDGRKDWQPSRRKKPISQPLPNDARNDDHARGRSKVEGGKTRNEL